MAEVPEPLTSDKVEAQVLRQEVWHRINSRNQHYMAALVGPEGSGKSWTALKIAELIDPTFGPDRVMFDPHTFMEQLTAWKDAGETRGKMIVVDEAGVGIGSRSWYDKDQIQLNKVLQVIRSENMGMLFTLPRLSELDSQTRGRLRAMIEMDGMTPGLYADVKYLRWFPARDERSKIYRKYPIIGDGANMRKVRRLRFGPPSEGLIDGYEARKDTFQAELYAETTDQIGDEDGERDVTDIAEEIFGDSLDEYISVSSSNKMEFIDKELISIDYDISLHRANQVKKLLERKQSAREQTEATA
jgi:nicotinamide riboside kinase